MEDISEIFHSGGGDGTGVLDPDQTLHACPLCRKQFGRKDLRDRHRRRCQKSIGKIRPPKKRACERCTTSKLKCDYEKPSCSRCLSRSAVCQYNIGQGSVLASTDISEAEMLEREQAAPAEETSDFVSALLQIPNADPLQSVAMAGLEDSMNCQWDDLDQSGVGGDLLLHDGLLGGGLGESHGAEVAFTKAAALQIPTATPGGQNGGQNEEQKEHSSSLSAPFSLHFQPKSILEPADHLAQLIAKSLAATAAAEATKNNSRKRPRLYPGMFSLGEVARLVGEYPMRMLQPTFCSPFIHPTLCRQRPDGKGPPTPLAVAFACVSMKMHMESEGKEKEFVCETMSQERDKLIKQLPLVLDSYEETCVVLQALCIYGIEALIAANRFPSRLNLAVLHHEYLVRATRRLLQQIASTTLEGRFAHSFLGSPRVAGVDVNVDWKTWVVKESLRRTLFLVYIIHELLHGAETLDHAYFEPLFAKDEGGMYEHMALPSSDALWRAQNEDDWKRALDLEAVQSPTDIHLKLGDAERRVAGGDEPWVLEEFLHLPEVTRLILSVSPLYGAAQRCTYSQPILNKTSAST